MTRLEIAVRLVGHWTQSEDVSPTGGLIRNAFDIAEKIIAEEDERQSKDFIEQMKAEAAHAKPPPMATCFTMDGVPLGTEAKP